MSNIPVQNSVGRRQSAVKWVAVTALCLICACLLVEAGRGLAQARAGAGQGGMSGIFAVAGQITRDTYGLYLVDTQKGTICLHQYVPGTRKLHFRAARNVTFDLMMDSYNTELPPHEIKQLIEQHRRLKANTDKEPTAPKGGG